MSTQTTTPPAKSGSKPRDPQYAVLRKAEAGTIGDGYYFLVTEQVKAGTREKAIQEATKEGGDFIVIPTKFVSHHKRTVRQTTIDEFE